MPSGAAELVTQRPGRFSALVGNDEATKLDGFFWPLRPRQATGLHLDLEMPIDRFTSTQLRLKREVLRYWHPQIDGSRFHKGAISDEMWVHFKQFVQLCHAYRHWQQVSFKLRFPPPRQSREVGSNHSRKKRYNEWRSEICRSEGHMYNAAYLAADKMTDMSRLIGDAGQDDRLDWKLYTALRLAVDPFPKHERGRFSAAAFRAFDADCELQGKSEEIASKWLRHAGYRGASLRIDPNLRPVTPTNTITCARSAVRVDCAGTGGDALYGEDELRTKKVHP